MPELAEVEVVCQQLKETILKKEIGKIEVSLPRILRTQNESLFQELVGHKLESITRRGKYIVIRTDIQIILLVHLRMTGRLIYYDQGISCSDSYERARITFRDGSYLIYGDTRTLGGIYVYGEERLIDQKGYNRLGFEPLSSSFTGKILYELTRLSHKPIKTFLLDQRFVCGIGNIYADEALFKSRIRPLRKANALSKEECRRLHRCIRSLLRASIKRGGTSFRDYRNGKGTKGENQRYLAVYGRSGMPCLACGETLERIVIGGRSSVYCKRCQQ